MRNGEAWRVLARQIDEAYKSAGALKLETLSYLLAMASLEMSNLLETVEQFERKTRIVVEKCETAAVRESVQRGDRRRLRPLFGSEAKA